MARVYNAEMKINNGLNLDLELQQQSTEDWVFGATSLVCLANIPEELRAGYLPTGELQFGKEDFMSCASIGPINILEAKFNYLYRENKLTPTNRKWLEDKGYFDNGEVKFSDRFIAIKSNTIRSGNSMIAPLDAIHTYGLIPKTQLPANPQMTFDNYHNKNDITKEMEDLGKDFLSRFKINYERVYEERYEQLLHEDFLNVAAYAWTTPINGEYPSPGNLRPTHVFIAWKTPKYWVFDNYLDEGRVGDFVKKLAHDYTLVDFAYRLFITAETTPETTNIQLTVFETLKKYGLLAFFAAWWENFTKKP